MGLFRKDVQDENDEDDGTIDFYAYSVHERKHG
jgi:hypothetical protein